jgi:hypothetical protein
MFNGTGGKTIEDSGILASLLVLHSTADAKGDILAASGDNLFARLAVGTDGQVLTAASGQATGLQWSTPSTTGHVTNGDSHDHAGGDGAQVDHGGLGGLSDNDHTQYILHSIADSAGDMLMASGADTFIKLAVGTTGQVLTLSGTTPTWTTHTHSTDADTLDGSHANAFAVAAKGVTNGDSHDHVGGDGAQVDHGGLGGLGDDDHTQYIKHALSTAAGDLLVGSGSNTYQKLAIGTALQILRVNSGATALEWATHAAHAATDADTLDGSHAAAFVLHSIADAQGDLLVASGADTFARLALGTNGYVLTSNGTTAVWAAASGGVTDHGALTGLADNDHTQYILHSIADAAGDMLVASGADTFARLAKGTDGQILTMVAGAVAWAAQAGGGDVLGPASSTNHNLPQFNGTNNKTIEDSGIAASDVNLKATLTTKGDLYVATAAGTITRLGIGSDNQVLTADAAQSAGMKWASIAGTGDVVGPGSSTDHNLPQFNGTSGKTIEDSGVAIANVLLKTLADAKGDILAATADNTITRLGVGSDGQVLTAASGQATGLQWSTPSTTGHVTNGDSHDHAGGDGAQVDHGGLGGLGDDDHTQYIKHALSTAAGDLLVGSGSNTYQKLAIGTALQILRVNSGATALEWATHAAHAATDADTLDTLHATAFVQHSLADAKGDILAATADNTITRLGVGSDGQVLTAASGQATGLQWSTPSTTGHVTNGDSHDHAGGDGAQVDHGGLAGLSDNDHTQYILHSIADAQGDILVASGADTFARLAKGASGYVLQAGASTLSWANVGVTNGDSHDHAGGDGGQIDHGGLAGLSDDDHTQYIKHSLADAQGDLLVASGNDAFARLALGSSGYVLASNGTTAAWTNVGVTNGNSHDHNGGDGAQIDHGGLAGLSDDDHTQYIKHSIADAQGDLLVASSADTFARLALGTNGYVLTSNGTTAAWAAPAGGSSFWTAVPGSPARSDNDTFTLTDTSNANKYDKLLAPGTIVKWTESSAYKQAIIVAATYATNTVTCDIVGDTMASIDSSSLKYFCEKVKQFCWFIPGTFAGGNTDIGISFYTIEPIYAFMVNAYVKTAGTTNSLTFDVNDDGATIMTTKPSIASGATSDVNNVVDNVQTEIAAGSIITLDCDATHTTSALHGHIYLYYMPVAWRYMT